MITYKWTKTATLLALTACSAVRVWGQQPAATPKPLTIQEAVRIALDKNASVLEARDEVAAARARIGEARAGLYPQLSGSSEYTDFTSVPTFALPSPSGGTPTVFSLLPTNQVVSTISAHQDLYTGGGTQAQVSRSHALYDVALGRLGATEAQTALQTRQAFYNVLLNQARVNSDQQTLAAAQKQLADANARFEAGTAARFDVLRTQTQVSEAQQALVQDSNQVDIAKVSLNRLLSLPLSTSFVLTEPALAPVPKDDLAKLLSTADRQRAEILSARASLKASEYGIRVAKSAAYPQLGITASYEDVLNQSASEVSTWTFVAGISQEIFDAGRIHSSIRAAKSLRDQAQVSLSDTIQGVEQDVRQAHLNLITARQTMDTSATRLAQATEAYDVATVRYESGVGTATELADALATLTAARANVDTAKFGYNIAFATLQRALGLSTY